MGISLAALPAERLNGDSGPASSAFVERGVTSYRAAAYWTLRLPYGANDDYRSNSVVFSQGRGTCFSKHGIMAELAGELGLEIHKYLSFYLCDASYFPQSLGFLSRSGLPGVPRVHCVLMADGSMLDLTTGNCHGKARDVRSEDLFLRCDPFVPHAAVLAAYRGVYPLFQARHPALSALPADEAWAISRDLGRPDADACALTA
jgi:hypothetical protein